MMYKDIATLIVVTAGKDADGFDAEIETPFEIYTDKKSVVRSEFYASLQAGITATAVFETRVCDFEAATMTDANEIRHDATRVLHEGKKYKIIRTYSKDSEMLEITCADLGA